MTDESEYDRRVRRALMREVRAIRFGLYKRRLFLRIELMGLKLRTAALLMRAKRL